MTEWKVMSHCRLGVEEKFYEKLKEYESWGWKVHPESLCGIGDCAHIMLTKRIGSIKYN